MNATREYSERVFGKEITNIMYARFDEPTEILNTGGGSMVSVWTLHDGTILTLNDELIVHHRDIDEFWCEGGEYKDIDSLSFWDDVEYSAEWSDAMTVRVTEWVDSVITKTGGVVRY